MRYYDAKWGPKFVVIELHMAHKDLTFWLVGSPMSQVERPEILQLVSQNKFLYLWLVGGLIVP